MLGGQLRVVLNVTLAGERIAIIEAVADPDRIARMDVSPLNT